MKQALFALHRKLVLLPRAHRITDAIVELAGPSRSLLDVGAGDGAIASAVAARIGATRVVGVDVLVRPVRMIEVHAYDGRHLPFPDRSFEIVTLSDVLHHCEAPGVVLAEAMRVASRAVIVKDHFRFGPISRALLHTMDIVGNAEAGVLVRGTYFSPAEWIDLAREAGGRITELRWPMKIHSTPLRLVTRDELQFAARLEPVAPTAVAEEETA